MSCKDTEVATYYRKEADKTDDQVEKISNFYRISFNLTQYRLFPRWVVRMLLKNKWYKNFWFTHQEAFFKLARIGRTISIFANVRILLSYFRLVDLKMKSRLEELTQVEAIFK